MSPEPDAEQTTGEPGDRIGSRRRFLQAICAAGTVGLAGCQDTSPPTITDATIPPTAVETDEPITFSLTIDLGDADGEEEDESGSEGQVIPDAEARVVRRGSYVATIDAETETTVDGDQQEIEFTFDSPSEVASDYGASRPEGLGYEIEVQALYGPHPLADFSGLGHVLGPDAFGDGNTPPLEFRTYAFDRVDSLAAILVRGAGESVGATGASLYAEYRRVAEFVCEHYASGLGSMGGLGLAFEFVTRTHDAPQGWLELDDPKSQYDRSATGQMPEALVEAALDAAADDLGVVFDDFDTAAVLTGSDYGRAFYVGDYASAPLEVPLGPFTVELPTGALQNFLPVSAHDTPSGRIDAWYDELDGDAWRHEIGHSLGTGTRSGLPDLYDPNRAIGNLGVVDEWGLMGSGETVTSYCRVLGGDFFSRNYWLSPDRQRHLVGDTTVDLQPLTESELDDAANYLTSAWADFEVSVEMGGPFGGVPTGVEVSPTTVHARTYVLEGRLGGDSSISDPRRGAALPRSPSTDDGVKLYRFGRLDFDGTVDLGRIFDGNSPVEVDSLVPVNVTTVPQSAGDEAEPTLSLDKSSRFETLADGDAAATFEQTAPVASGSPSVTVERDPQGLLGDEYDTVAEVVEDVTSYLDDVLSDALGSTTHEEPLPGVDVLVENEAGERVGTDPETGRRYEEIEGARVSGHRYRRSVAVPGSEDVTVTVSTRRLRARLAELGREVPEEIPYTQTLLLTDSSAAVDDERSREIDELEEPVPYLQGRTRQTARATLPEEPQTVVESAEVALDPDVAAEEQGDSRSVLFADLTFDRAVDPEGVVLETVALGSVPALSEDEHAYVEDPVVERGEETVVRVGFNRAEVREAYERGEHDVFVSGAFDGASFYATGRLQVD